MHDLIINNNNSTTTTTTATNICNNNNNNINSINQINDVTDTIIVDNEVIVGCNDNQIINENEREEKEHLENQQQSTSSSTITNHNFNNSNNSANLNHNSNCCNKSNLNHNGSRMLECNNDAWGTYLIKQCSGIDLELSEKLAKIQKHYLEEQNRKNDLCPNDHDQQSLSQSSSSSTITTTNTVTNSLKRKLNEMENNDDENKTKNDNGDGNNAIDDDDDLIKSDKCNRKHLNNNNSNTDYNNKCELNDDNLITLQTIKCNDLPINKLNVNSLNKCRDCYLNGVNNEICRFIGWRKLKLNRIRNDINELVGEYYSLHGYLDLNDINKDDCDVWWMEYNNYNNNSDQSQLKNDITDLSISKFIFNYTYDQLIDIIDYDIKFQNSYCDYNKEKVYWKRQINGTRELCDQCDTSIFNGHYVCSTCGFSVCLNCYELRTKNKNLRDSINKQHDDFRWYYCNNDIITDKKVQHLPLNLVYTQYIPPQVLEYVRHNLIKYSTNNIKINKEEPSKQTSSSSSSSSSSINQNDTNNDQQQQQQQEQLFEWFGTNNKNKFLCINNKYVNDINKSSVYNMFDREWSSNRAIMIRNVHLNLNQNIWSPESFMNDFGDLNVDLVNCKTQRIVQNVKMRQFWLGFENSDSRLLDQNNKPMILKLKDWPPAEDFRYKLPTRYADLMDNLPLPDYTKRDGCLNMVKYLPERFVKPDLGPKLYIAYSSADTPKAGTTNLHVDVSDAANLMLYVGVDRASKLNKSQSINSVSSPTHSACSSSSNESTTTTSIKTSTTNRKHNNDDYMLNLLKKTNCDNKQIERYLNGEKVGAIWHIFLPQDADKIRTYLALCEIQKGKTLRADHDPIHDQNHYIDNKMLIRLEEDCDVHALTLIQYLGDVIFIPAGAPHQVRNINSCIKVAEDFVTPQGIKQCILLTDQFRRLSDTHSNHEDKLQEKYNENKEMLDYILSEDDDEDDDDDEDYINMNEIVNNDDNDNDDVDNGGDDYVEDESEFFVNNNNNDNNNNNNSRETMLNSTYLQETGLNVQLIAKKDKKLVKLNPTIVSSLTTPKSSSTIIIRKLDKLNNKNTNLNEGVNMSVEYTENDIHNNNMNNNGNNTNEDDENQIKPKKLKNIQVSTIIKKQINLNNSPNTDSNFNEKSSKTMSICFQCNICTKMFTNQSHYKNHMLSHKMTQNEANTSSNGTSNNGTNNLSSVKSSSNKTKSNQQLSSSVTNRYICNECGKQFNSQNDFNRHLMIHEGVKPYKCSLCPMSFYDTSSKNRHEKEHSGLKPFRCYICGFEFTRASNLRAHLLKLHSNEIGKSVTISKSSDNKLKFEFDLDAIKLLKEQQRLSKMNRTHQQQPITPTNAIIYIKDPNNKSADIQHMVVYVDGKPIFVQNPKITNPNQQQQQQQSQSQPQQQQQTGQKSQHQNNHTRAKIPYLLAAAAAAAANAANRSNMIKKDVKQDNEYQQLVTMFKQKNERLFNPLIVSPQITTVSSSGAPGIITGTTCNTSSVNPLQLSSLQSQSLDTSIISQQQQQSSNTTITTNHLSNTITELNTQTTNALNDLTIFNTQTTDINLF